MAMLGSGIGAQTSMLAGATDSLLNEVLNSSSTNGVHGYIKCGLFPYAVLFSSADASTMSEKARIPCRDAVTILGETKDQFSKVRIATGNVGYVNSQLIREGLAPIEQEAPAPAPLLLCEGSTKIPTGYVIADEQEDTNECPPVSFFNSVRKLTLLLPRYMTPPITVCADSPVPAGYIATSYVQTPNKCRVITQTPNQPGDMTGKVLQCNGCQETKPKAQK